MFFKWANVTIGVLLYILYLFLTFSALFSMFVSKRRTQITEETVLYLMICRVLGYMLAFVHS